MSLITADNTFLLAAVLLSLAAFGFWAETTSIGRKLSGALIIIFLSVVLSNIGLVPHSAPMYGSVSSILVPLAIPMLLFRADLREVLVEIGPMLKAFVASATVITFTMTLLVLLFDFGPYEAQIGGILTAGYIGGSLNFVATAQVVELPEANHYVALLTADVIGAIFFLMMLMSLPALALARRAMPSRYIAEDGRSKGESSVVGSSKNAPAFNLVGLSLALAASMAICAVGDLLATWLEIGNFFILIITVFALAVANFAKPLVKRFNSEFEIGTFFMYVFFITIGAAADIQQVAGVAVSYVVLVCAAVVAFLVLIIAVGKLMKLDLAELMVAANACILGPATAAAMAAGQGWRDLITPGMFAGILGYSVGTFVGVALTKLMM